MNRNLPNAITLFRTSAGLVVPLMLFVEDDTVRLTALALYLLAAATDWLDGVLARRFNATSHFGRMLDPIADKLLLAGCLFALVAAEDWGWPMFIPALLIILREVLVSGLREYVSAHDIALHVTWLAKFKTAAQLVAVGFAIGLPAMPPYPHAHSLALALMWLAAALTVVSGWDYFQKVLRHDLFS